MSESEKDAMQRRLSVAVATWEIGVFEHDYSTGLTWASQRFREMLGFEADEHVSMSEVARLSFPADVPMIQAEMQRVHQPDSDGIFDLVYRVIRTDGEVRWVHGRGVTVFSEDNGVKRPSRTTGTILDVTEREELRLAAERQERRLSEAMATSQVGVFDWDHDPARPEQAIYWSRSFREMHGYDLEVLPNIEWYQSRIHPDDLRRFREAMQRTLDPEVRSALDVEYRWLHTSGEIRWLVARSSTSFHHKGSQLLPRRTVGATLDITSTKRAAEQLAQRSALLDATPDIVCILDSELRPVFLNQAGRSFARLGEEEGLAQLTLSEVAGAAFHERVQREGRVATARDGSWQVQLDFEGPTQERRPVSALLIGHQHAEAGVRHYSLVARDLTSERKLEDQFRQAQKMEVIGRLAGGVAHDFNNILSVILGFSDVLEDKLRDQTSALNDLQEIRFAAERAASLTRQLLSISRKELARPRSIDLAELLRSSLPMFRRVIDATITIQWSVPEAPALVKADPGQIEQVLLNLVVNARDAMPSGGELRLELSQVIVRPGAEIPGVDLAPGSFVVLAVTDSGHGMPPEVRSRVFEPFFTTKAAGHGTGLGLSTVADIVGKAGGKIWVHSEVHKGTTFKVYLPATDEIPETRLKQATSPLPHKGGTILLVEDELQLRAMLTSVLSRAGYRVLDASGPVEAIGISHSYGQRIDLLLTDVVMPQMTGPTLATELKLRRPELIVLFMSGYTEDSVVHRGLVEDKLHFLSKPLSVGALLRTVAELLHDGQTQVA